MLFESDNDEERGGSSGDNQLLEDNDYTNSNKNYQRVRNYSFARN